MAQHRLELQQVEVEGVNHTAWTFVHGGVLIHDPRVSECGRFDVEPGYYGLSLAERDRIVFLNKLMGAIRGD